MLTGRYSSSLVLVLVGICRIGMLTGPGLKAPWNVPSPISTILTSKPTGNKMVCTATAAWWIFSWQITNKDKREPYGSLSALKVYMVRVGPQAAVFVEGINQSHIVGTQLKIKDGGIFPNPFGGN